MYNEGLDPELVSLKYRIQDMIVNYFNKSNKLDLLEYKFITDLDTLETLSFELNTQKEILKQLNKYHKETCKKCQFKILQTIKNIRSATPTPPSRVRRKVPQRKNMKYATNKKSVSPKFRELKINQNQNIDDISSIIKDDDRTSFYSTSNNNIIQAQKQKQKNYLVNKDKRMKKTIGNNNINKINKNNNIYGKNNNRKLTPDKYNVYKNGTNIDKNNNNLHSRTKSNLSEDKYNNINPKKKINQKISNSKSPINKDKNKSKTKFNNVKSKNNTNKPNLNISNNKIKNFNTNGSIKHKLNKTEYKLEDYQVIGDYIPRFPDEKDLEDDYFYYDTDKENKENKNEINIKNNEQNENKSEKENSKKEIDKVNINNDSLNISDSFKSANFNQAKEKSHNSFISDKENKINEKLKKYEKEISYI